MQRKIHAMVKTNATGYSTGALLYPVADGRVKLKQRVGGEKVIKVNYLRGIKVGEES